MIKFWLAARPRLGMTSEQFDYEWGVIHPSLMVTTPVVMEKFKRYIQHRVIENTTADMSIYRISPDREALSDHWVDSIESLTEIFAGEDYPRRMFGHAFGDTTFVIELTSGEILHDQPDPFTGRGGVKLVNFVYKRDEVSQEDFVRFWRDDYASKLLTATTKDRDLVRRYVQNPQLPLDASLFAGSLFEAGGVQTYAGIEELWFDDLDSLATLSRDDSLREEVLGYGEGYIDRDKSFAMVVTERVVWDQTLPGAPVPSILDPASFESRLVAAEPPNDQWRTVKAAAPRR
ncbi:EthD domain-containing protein [Rhodococcus sp. NPDC057297]|uniref:EthD domain-containing protein n=1 Tax=Rhodococcus sp. NPDC057297 TaxID=3346090 RepID=UPI00363591F8